MFAVIPARGGSKTVLRKNLALVDGKPLLCHIGDTLKRMGYRVVVSTDDPEIASVAKVHYEVIERPARLAGDDVPVADVAGHACQTLDWTGRVLVAQPTCPFVGEKTIHELTSYIPKHDAATLATRNTHLLRTEQGPLTGRVNRQNLSGVWTEIGVRAFRNPSYLHAYPQVFHEVSGREALDIDTLEDLAGARLTRKAVRFRVRANREVGSGHLRRCLLLANQLQHHDISVEFVESEDWAEAESPYPVYGPADLIVNDTLDTTPSEMGLLRAEAPVVTFEDLGAGARHADLVVNALYPGGPADLTGGKWADLRPEFAHLPPYEITDQRRIMVMFGGTDPSELGSWVRKYFPDTTWIQPGDARSIAWEMTSHDLLITSAGRTVYEAAAVGIPAVVLAQNPREATHSHLNVGNVYLGLGRLVTVEQLDRTVTSLLESPVLRRQLSDQARASVDGRGVERIVYAIEGLLRGIIPWTPGH